MNSVSIEGFPDISTCVSHRGAAAAVLTPANLRLAYGAQMTVIATPEGALVLEDTCCEGHED